MPSQSSAALRCCCLLLRSGFIPPRLQLPEQKWRPRCLWLEVDAVGKTQKIEGSDLKSKRALTTALLTTLFSGLRTALELLRRNVSVVLKSSRHPLSPISCSVGAGGLWMPYQCNDPRVSGWAMETLDELWKESAAPDSTVELVHAVMLKREHEGPNVQDFISKDYKEGQGGDSPLPEWTTDRRLDFQHLTV